MDDVKLINCVKRYPEVYDPKNIDFKCTDRKELFWAEISRELCNSGKNLKISWFPLFHSLKFDASENF